MGTIYNSRYKSGPMITMHSRLNIPSSFKNSTPGPGSYQHFSQFGIWVPKNKTDGYNVRKRVKSAKNSDINFSVLLSILLEPLLLFVDIIL